MVRCDIHWNLRDSLIRSWGDEVRNRETGKKDEVKVKRGCGVSGGSR